MRHTRVFLVLALVVAIVACSGTRGTRFTVHFPNGDGGAESASGPNAVASTLGPGLLEMGFKESASPDRVPRWSGVGGVEIRIEPKAGKVIVTVSEHFTGWSWPSPEYRSTRKRVKVALRSRFGERNVTIQD
jgi:hypothetical protein